MSLFIKTFALIFLLSSSMEDNLVMLSNAPQIVPSNKKWVIKSGQEVALIFSDAATEYPNACGALIAGKTKILNYIQLGAKGQFNNPDKIYRLISLSDPISQSGKVYSWKIDYIVDHTADMYNIDDIKSKAKGELTFTSGQTVSVNGCISNLIIHETPQ